MGESDLLSSGNSAVILKLTQPAQKGPFLPNSTSLPSPDALRAKLTSPDHSLIGVRYVVHGLGGGDTQPLGDSSALCFQAAVKQWRNLPGQSRAPTATPGSLSLRAAAKPL